MIKFVYFDLGGVVIDNHKRTRDMARDFGLDPVKLDEYFDTHWKKICSGEVDSKAFMKDMKSALEIDSPADDFVPFVAGYQGFFQETHDLIHELSSEYKLGILSNAELGLIDLHLTSGKIPAIGWSAIIESAQHKTLKPEEKIFLLAEKLAGVDPSEIFFIDDVSEYIQAVRKRGWQGEVFDTHHRAKSIKKIKSKLMKS